MSLFADDIKISNETNFSLQSVLDNIYKWQNTRKLDLNSNKIKILTLKKNLLFEPTDQLIDNSKIPTTKFLGIKKYIYFF